MNHSQIVSFIWGWRNLEPQFRRASGFAFYNTSRYDFEKLLADAPHIAQNLRHLQVGPLHEVGGSGRRCATAISSASITSSVRRCVAIAQPTTRRPNTSRPMAK